MATAREVKNILSKFTKEIKRANKDIEEILDVIRDLEKALVTYDANEDLNITRGIQAEIRKGKEEISELRKNINKLEREVSDTNRKYQNLAR